MNDDLWCYSILSLWLSLLQESKEPIFRESSSEFKASWSEKSHDAPDFPPGIISSPVVLARLFPTGFDTQAIEAVRICCKEEF